MGAEVLVRRRTVSTRRTAVRNVVDGPCGLWFTEVMTTTTEMIDNKAWLAGYAAFKRGEGCPWNASGRLGWIAAKRDAGVK